MQQPIGNRVIHDQCETEMLPLVPLSDPNKSEFYCPACHFSIPVEKMTGQQRTVMTGYIRSKQAYAQHQTQSREQPRE